MSLDFFTPVDAIVAAAVIECAEVTGGAAPVVPAAMIQAYTRDSDPLGDIQGRAWGGWIRIIPREIRKERWSSAEDRYVLSYSIEYGHKGLSRQRCNIIASAIEQAVGRLEAGLQADGVTPIVQPSPLRIESCERVNTEREREPIDDPEEWADAADVDVTAFAARADVAARELDGVVPTVTTTAARFDGAATGYAGGTITAIGSGGSVTAWGVCWGEAANPTIDDAHYQIGSGDIAEAPYSFARSAAMTGLSPGTTYHARCYGINAAGTGYGEDVEFVYPFPEPIAFVYDGLNLTLTGLFTLPLEESESLSSEGWSAVLPFFTGNVDMCLVAEVGRTRGRRLIWHGSDNGPSGEVENVTYTNPAGDLKDAWGVPVPAFVCDAVFVVNDMFEEW